MKRTPLKRKTPLRSKSVLHKRNRKRAAARRKRDFGDYADWIATLPCAVRGAYWTARLNHSLGWMIDRVEHRCSGDISAHHVRSRGAGGHAWANLLPLCAHAHADWHNWGRETWARRYGLDPVAVATALAARYEQEKGG